MAFDNHDLDWHMREAGFEADKTKQVRASMNCCWDVQAWCKLSLCHLRDRQSSANFQRPTHMVSVRDVGERNRRCIPQLFMVNIHTNTHAHTLHASTHVLGFLHGMGMLLELSCYYKTRLIQSNALHTYHDHTTTSSYIKSVFIKIRHVCLLPTGEAKY